MIMSFAIKKSLPIHLAAILNEFLRKSGEYSNLEKIHHDQRLSNVLIVRDRV
jgi:hypothetical protein